MSFPRINNADFLRCTFALQGENEKFVSALDDYDFQKMALDNVGVWHLVHLTKLFVTTYYNFSSF